MALRKEVIVFLAAVSSILINAASQAGVTPDLQQLENALPVAIRIDTPHMISWNICIAPRSGSALSIHSRPQEAPQPFSRAAMQKNLCSGCDDPAEEARKRNTLASTRSADPKEGDSSWSACDADGFDDPNG